MKTTLSPGKEGEQAAKSLRGRWGLEDSSPIDNIFHLLENHGLNIVRWPFDADIPGCLADIPRVGHTIFINSNQYKIRGRKVFTTAHELCHWESNDYEDDGVFWENNYDRDEKPDIEVKADAFAAEFLMPRKAISGIIEELDLGTSNWTPEKIITLQMRFNVSFKAMLARLFFFDYLDDQGKQRMAEEVSPVRKAFEMGYDEEDIFGKQGLVLPQKFRNYAIKALKKNVISVKKFQSLLNLTEEQLNQKLEKMGLLDELGTESAPNVNEMFG